DGDARLDELERPLAVLVAAQRHDLLHLRDEDARPDAHLDLALDLERDQRLSHRRPRDAQLLRQLALGRQTLAGGELARGDELRELPGDLAIEAVAADGLDGHAS